jgi:carbamate kinase
MILSGDIPQKSIRKKTALVALGGNALVRKGQAGTIEEQFENLRIPIRQIAELTTDHSIIITHGNGPQVGNLLLQQECCDAVPKLPLEILVAQTQGQIGYMIESTLDSELMELGMSKDLVSLLSYVVVGRDDPAFANPTKPIGPLYSRKKAAALPFPTGKTARGYRRLVASPRPVSIVEKREISKLLDLDFIVVCCGGGGIPVIRQGRKFHGVDAVVDKDLASAKLAEELQVDLFLMATDVDGAYLDYGKPGQRLLQNITVGQIARHSADGHFGSGSMGPKVEAAMEYIGGGGKKAVITSIAAISRAVAGEAGTVITA